MSDTFNLGQSEDIVSLWEDIYIYNMDNRKKKELQKKTQIIFIGRNPPFNNNK